MALTAAEEALVRELIAQNPELLSLAGNEATIISKLGATKKNLSQLAAALSLNDTDLAFVRQGTSDKSVALSVLKAFAVAGVPAASETVSGIVELATSAEAQAFTANKFIDGAKLADAFKGSNVSLATNGYQKLPGGLILQWGMVAVSPGTSYAVALPTTFPSAIVCSVATALNNGLTANNYVQSHLTSRSQINLSISTSGPTSVSWIAIGY